MKALSPEICFQLRDARRQAGLSQQVLAAEVGCKQSALSMFEQGRPTKLSTEAVLLENAPVGELAARRAALEKLFAANGNIVNGGRRPRPLLARPLRGRSGRRPLLRRLRRGAGAPLSQLRRLGPRRRRLLPLRPTLHRVAVFYFRASPCCRPLAVPVPFVSFVPSVSFNFFQIFPHLFPDL